MRDRRRNIPRGIGRLNSQRVVAIGQASVVVWRRARRKSCAVEAALEGGRLVVGESDLAGSLVGVAKRSRDKTCRRKMYVVDIEGKQR